MKFKAHQSFFIRKGWLSKGLLSVFETPSIFMPSNSKEAMDELGLGSNQVVALRYWLSAVGLIKKASGNKSHELTEFGELVRKNDPYAEELGTLWALHYNLACNKEEATSWYFMFNEFKAKIFSKVDFVNSIQKYIALYDIENDNGNKAKALSSIESDIDCILSTYISGERISGKPASPESVIACPLCELGLLDIENRKTKTFRKKTANNSTLPPLLVMFAIVKMIELKSSQDDSWVNVIEIPLDDILLGTFSPGLLFNLDSVALLSKLYELEDGGYLRINNTAGSDVARITNADKKAIDYLSTYYKLIG